MKKGKLYLIPVIIAEDTADDIILPQVKEIVKNTNHFLVENIRTARRFISALKTGKVIEDIYFEVLDKKTDEAKIKSFLNPILSGNDMGIMSEAGCPGIADPGSKAVLLAHQLGIQVIPLVGPSSIFLALMASGFNGQKFKFHGYLPIDKGERVKAIKQLEKESQQQNQTQIFMDTPYRNNQLLEDLFKNCSKNTNLCIAKDITGADEFIKSKTIGMWKSSKPELHKIPVIFVLYAGGNHP